MLKLLHILCHRLPAHLLNTLLNITPASLKVSFTGSASFTSAFG